MSGSGEGLFRDEAAKSPPWCFTPYLPHQEAPGDHAFEQVQLLRGRESLSASPAGPWGPEHLPSLTRHPAAATVVTVLSHCTSGSFLVALLI